MRLIEAFAQTLDLASAAGAALDDDANVKFASSGGPARPDAPPAEIGRGRGRSVGRGFCAREFP